MNESHASTLRRDGALLALIALHPLWIAVRPFGEALGLAGKIGHVTVPWVELAWFVDLVLTAWLIGKLAPLPDPRRPVRKPPQKLTHTGFEARLDPAGSIGGRAVVAALGVLVATAGMTAWILLATFLDRDSYGGMFEQLSVATYVGLSAVGTAVLQGGLAAVGWFRELLRRPTSVVGLDGRVLRHQKRSLALSGRTATELRGQQLVLTDEDGGMTIAGDPAHLRWIAERVAEIQPRGDASDVPQELRQVADAVRAERSGVRG